MAMNKLVLAGGCFWGVEAYFAQLKGVAKTRVGYIDGNKANPTYEEVCNGRATHAEAVELFYDDLSLESILDHYFRIIDPTSLNKQGNDRGVQYRTGIYTSSVSELERIAKWITNKQKEYNKPIVVQLKPESPFYEAETYHQEYLKKNPNGYCHIDLGLARKDERKAGL
jgi:peptide-methionine (S)-S-oxide reductase